MKQNTASLRVVAELRERIRAGTIPAGHALPSARQIVAELGVALATASKAIAILKREGLVRVEPGIGTIVRGQRAPDLSRARIVEAAIAIADDEGTAGLTMRTVAKELGVATMSLYRHVANKELLLELMADAALAETPVPKPLRDPKKQLAALARLQWDGYKRHRWLAPMISMTRPQLLPNGMKHTEAVLVAMSQLGLSDRAVELHGIALLGIIRGLACGLEAEREAEADTGMDQSEWMAVHGDKFVAVMATLPTLSRLTQLDIEMNLDVLFETAVAAFLAGIRC